MMSLFRIKLLFFSHLEDMFFFVYQSHCYDGFAWPLTKLLYCFPSVSQYRSQYVFFLIWTTRFSVSEQLANAMQEKQ